MKVRGREQPGSFPHGAHRDRRETKVRHDARNPEQATKPGSLSHQQFVEEKLLEAAMGQAAAVIAHELRQPLSAIQNLASYVRQTTTDSSAHHNLHLLEQQAELAGRILANLVAFARSGKTERKAVDVPSILDEVLGRICWRPEIVLQKKLESPLPPALADPLHIDRILANLITNAIESMEHGGILTLSASADRGHVVIEVCDTGCGIPPDHETAVFQPFVTTKRNGTGLGLALCRQLAEANGGSISFLSCPGAGTTFTLRLAAARTHGRRPSRTGVAHREISPAS